MELLPVENEEKLTKRDIALNKAGATRELAYKTYVEACSATIMKYDRDGDCIGEYPDHPTRTKAADSISRLNGDFKEGIVIDNKVVNITGVSTEVMNGLLHMVKDVADQLRLLRSSGKQTGEIIDVESI